MAMKRGTAIATDDAASESRSIRNAAKSGHSMTAFEQIRPNVLNFVISLVTLFGRLERLMRPLY
jgi:hypothetical protein